MASTLGKKGAAPAARKSGPTPVSTYKLYIRKISASDLPGGSGVDPYIALQLEGSKTTVQTEAISGDPNPVFDGEYELDGGLVGSDVLKITAFSKKNAIGAATLPVRDIPLGVTADKTIGFQKVVKGKTDKKSAPGSAGTVRLQLSAQRLGTDAWSDSPWSWPLYSGSIEFVTVAEAPHVDKEVERFMVLKLTPSLNEQKTRTRGHKGPPAKPFWNEAKEFLIGDYDLETFDLSLWQNPTGSQNSEKLGRSVVVVKEVPLGDAIEQEFELRNEKTGGTAGYITVKITLHNDNPAPIHVGDIAVERVADDEEEEESGVEPVPAPVPVPAQAPVRAPVSVGAPVQVRVPVSVGAPAPAARKVKWAQGGCVFDWNSVSSSYSTSFTGYTSYGKSLSDLSSSEEKAHHHEGTVGRKAPKPKVRYLVKGTIVGATGLPKLGREEANSYVTVDVVGKWKAKGKTVKSEVANKTTDPQYDLEFDFGQVKKGVALEFVVWQAQKSGDAVPIAFAKKPLKEIEVDNRHEVEIQLSKPLKRLPRNLQRNTDWGYLSVAFDITLCEVDNTWTVHLN
jgi:hypothetical protein